MKSLLTKTVPEKSARGAVTQSDIDALQNMFSNLGIVSKIINVPLKAAEKAAQTKLTKTAREKS